MGTATFDRTVEQRLDALVIANRVRCARAVLKRDFRAGLVTVEDALDRPSDLLASMKVYELLVSIPMMGPVRASKLMGRLGLPFAKTVGGLTVRQRSMLLEAVR